MDKDVFMAPRDFFKCSENKPVVGRQRILQILMTSDPLQFVVKDIVGSLPRSYSGKRFALGMGDLYLK